MKSQIQKLIEDKKQELEDYINGNTCGEFKNLNELKAQIEILKQVQDILNKNEEVNKLTDDEIVQEMMITEMPENLSGNEITEWIIKEAIRLTREQCEKEQKDKIDLLKEKINQNLGWAECHIQTENVEDILINLRDDIETVFEKIFGDNQLKQGGNTKNDI
jgi:hypothetical protein